MKRVGIIRYPGSNCDYDALNYFDNSFFIWHTDTIFPEDLELLVIPGGFAFGDRVYDKATDIYDINPGKMAIQSPVTEIIREAVKRNIPILGICNGFQILIHLGLLPGKLILNKNKKFNCKKVNCVAHYFNNELKDTYKTDLYIANSYGRYFLCNQANEEEDYEELRSNNQIFLEYNENITEISSYKNIAGICNKERTIFGMMPHPERNNNDFKYILYKILYPNSTEFDNQIIFNNKIIELMHSEHISYKSTKKYLKTLPTSAEWVVQGPGENAGIVDIGDNYCIAIRIESHNHPTFIDPFEGAATGVGGILRDIFAMGARPIAILDFLRFGIDDNSKELLKNAIDGISYYGNCVGVPNVGGDYYIGKSYNKNPLVNVACLGIIKKENIIYGNISQNEQYMIYVGSKTGNEGIGGAAMASKKFDSSVDKNLLKDNIQKSDPFLEKLLLEACCEIADNKLAAGMQDLGAGGLLCATYEVVYRANTKYKKQFGCDIYLDKVPIKYQMEFINILISESQERMLIIANKNNVDKIFDIFKKWDLEYAVIGETNLSGKYTVYNKEEILYTEKINNIKDITQDWKINNYEESPYITKEDKVKQSSLWTSYDSTVGNRTIKGPDQSGSYSIIDIPENNKKIILSWDYDLSVCKNIISDYGGKPLCIVNCLNYGHPSDSLSHLVSYVNYMKLFCEKYQIPIVGGNVSLYNSTDNISNISTPIIVMLGLID